MTGKPQDSRGCSSSPENQNLIVYMRKKFGCEMLMTMCFTYWMPVFSVPGWNSLQQTWIGLRRKDAAVKWAAVSQFAPIDSWEAAPNAPAPRPPRRWFLVLQVSCFRLILYFFFLICSHMVHFLGGWGFDSKYICVCMYVCINCSVQTWQELLIHQKRVVT